VELVYGLVGCIRNAIYLLSMQTLKHTKYLLLVGALSLLMTSCIKDTLAPLPGSLTQRSPVASAANSIPAVPVISGPTSLTSGSSITLTATSGGATRYQWYVNNGPIAGATSATLAVSSAGYYQASAANAIGTSLVSAIYSVTAAAIPATPTISGTTSGSVTTLTASSINATSYQWYFNSNLIPGATSATLNVTAAGYYQVTATNANGTTPASYSYSLNGGLFPTIPTISGPTAVTPGSTITLTATAANATSYQWYLNGWPITGATSAALAVTVAGNYQVSAINSNGTSGASLNYAVN
jgi:membrane carboxypeptidase/penicillin-binding protein PbpC